jgi:hypothetical protein
LDRAIGVHFAADVEVSNRFAKGLYRDTPKDYSADAPEGGIVYRVKAPSDARCLIVPQKTYHFPHYSSKATDQSSVSGFVAGVVFEEVPALFIEWVMASRNVTREIAEKLYEKLDHHQSMHAKGEVYDTSALSFRSFVKNFDAGLFMLADARRGEVAALFNDLMAKRGIDALVYLNTSPEETREKNGIKVRSTKSYILLTHALDRYPVERVPLSAI